MTATIPRLPVLDWQTFNGAKNSATPCLLTLQPSGYTQSGRASILLALEMLAIGPGERVLLPTYHCPTMVAPVTHRAATPLFYPLRADGSPDLDWINGQDLSQVRAILVAHFFGLPQHLATLRAWCDARGIALIEDCAHALFGISDGKPVGSWGDLAIASLTKFLPVPEGGYLINNRLADTPIPALARPGLKSQVKAAFDIVHAGVNHGRLNGLDKPLAVMLRLLKPRKPLQTPSPPSLPDDEASDSSESYDIDLGCAHQALSTASHWMARRVPRAAIVQGRRQQYEYFAKAFAGSAVFHPFAPQLPEHCAPYVFPLWVANPDPGYLALRRLGLPVSRWDRLWPDVPVIAGDQGRDWSHHILQLACHQDLQPHELARMVGWVKSVYSPSATTTTTTSKGEA